MEIKQKNPADLIPYTNNAKQHSDDQITKIAASIQEFGFNSPVLIDNDDGIIAGHGRVSAALKLKLSEIPTINLSHLSDIQKQAYILADNRLGEVGTEWDFNLLSLELERLQEIDFDIDLTGFDDGFLIEEDQEGLTDDDVVPELPDKPITKRGDVWLMANHRLMCGDATMIDDVEKLMKGEKSDFGFCDPPYNLGYEYNSYDDNKSTEEYIEYSKLWFENLVFSCDKQAITLGTKNINVMCQLGEYAGVACWVKKNWITSCKIAKLQQWEPIFFFGDFTAKKRTSDLYEINRTHQKDVGEDHTCPKQINLILEILRNYCIDSVVDLFMGSGTTLIAAHKLNIICYGLELDEKYCDVIVKRWQDWTGEKATLESSGELFDR